MIQSAILWLSTVLVLLIFIISIYNSFSIRSLKKTNKLITSSVSILIPMRNEEVNAQESVASALNQKLLSKFEVIVRDDESTDSTLELLQKIPDSRLSIQIGKQLPTGWLGKNYAMMELAQASKGEYLIFLDADVRLSPTAIADSISLLEELGLDYLSPYPKQLAADLPSALVQPLLQWSWFSTLPLRLNEKSLRRSTAVANGQFFIVKRTAYLAVGGHSKIRDEVLDDLELARLLRMHAFRGSVIDGSESATCLMYPNFSQLLQGYSKSQWRAFGSIYGAISAIIFLGLTSIAPFLYAISGNSQAALLSLGVIFTRLLTAWKTQSIIWSSFLHPISIIIWVFLIIYSFHLKLSGKLQWRGRAL